MGETVDEPTQEQPKRRGWPKGKLRGPRKPKVEEPPAPPPISAQEPPKPKTFTEPVEATVVYKSGHSSTFEASEWEESDKEFRFTSYPEKRGHKIVHYFRREEIAAMSIMAPEAFFRTAKAEERPTVALPVKPQYIGGDPQVSIAPGNPRAPMNRARAVTGPGGIPQSIVTETDEQGNLREVVRGASAV